MNKHNQHGFELAGVAAVIIVVAIVGFIVWRVLSANQNTAAPSTVQETKSDELVLENIGLASVSDVLVTNDALREYTTHGLKGFYAFGDKLGNTGRTNPTFEFASLKPGTKVVAATSGVVAFIKEQPDSGDSEVFLQTFEGSAWVIGYDHLTSLSVQKGSTVKAGDVLGEPTAQGNGLLRFEIQINKKQADGSELSYCPSALLSPQVKDTVHAELAAMMQQWETLSGLDLYDIAAQQPVGCLAETVTP